MKPAAFAYMAPTSLDEAVSLLASHAPDAKPLAGGQSLVPIMNFRLAEPGVLIDLNHVSELDYIREANGAVAIGAMTRQFDAERSGLIGSTAPLVTEALKLTGHPTIRHRGTVGGVLAHADPASELPAVALALQAELTVRGPGGERTIPAEAFYLGPLTTALAPDELLVEVRIPRQPPGSGWAFRELSRRHGDFAICGVAAALTLAPDGTIQRASLALCGVGPTPVRAGRAEAALAGAEPGEPLFRHAGELAIQDIDPSADLHASADYRRRVAAVLVRRALTEAHERAREGR